jgi:hypothetical protein
VRMNRRDLPHARGKRLAPEEEEEERVPVWRSDLKELCPAGCGHKLQRRSLYRHLGAAHPTLSVLEVHSLLLSVAKGGAGSHTEAVMHGATTARGHV